MQKIHGKYYTDSAISAIKALIIFSLFLFSFTYPQEKKNKKNKFKITRIDSMTLKKSYLIYGTIKNKPALLCSKKGLEGSCARLIEGKCYKLQLREIGRIELDDLTFGLYTSSIYLDNKLIVKQGTTVFESDDIKGLCFTTRNR
jgi:hypothetical protein